MRKLLSAGFARLSKNKVFLNFWHGNHVPSGRPALFLNSTTPISNTRLRSHWTISFFFVYTLAIAISASAFCSLFIGTEYSDGTIRNKLVVGHTRGTIYLSNLIVSMAAALFDVPFLYPRCLCRGHSAYRLHQNGDCHFSGCARRKLCHHAGFCSIFTLVSMLCQNQAVTAVICIWACLRFYSPRPLSTPSWRPRSITTAM